MDILSLIKSTHDYLLSYPETFPQDLQNYFFLEMELLIPEIFDTLHDPSGYIEKKNSFQEKILSKLDKPDELKILLREYLLWQQGKIMTKLRMSLSAHEREILGQIFLETKEEIEVGSWM
jgi:hypothetical protein